MSDYFKKKYFVETLDAGEAEIYLDEDGVLGFGHDSAYLCFSSESVRQLARCLNEIILELDRKDK